MIRSLLLAALASVMLTATAWGQKPAPDGGAADEADTSSLEALLAAAQAEIDHAGSLMERAAQDPENLIVIDVEGALVALDRRDIETAVTLTAALAHDYVGSSDTALGVFQSVAQRAVDARLDALNRSVSDFDLSGLTTLVSAAAGTVMAETGPPSEAMLRDRIAAAVEARLAAQALDAEALAEAVLRRQELYDLIDARLDAVMDAAEPEDATEMSEWAMTMQVLGAELPAGATLFEGSVPGAEIGRCQPPAADPVHIHVVDGAACTGLWRNLGSSLRDNFQGARCVWCPAGTAWRSGVGCCYP
ncbi:MAG: hypothetical protein RLO50_00215 [Azospirillaceae bacterium]